MMENEQETPEEPTEQEKEYARGEIDPQDYPSLGRETTGDTSEKKMDRDLSISESEERYGKGKLNEQSD